MGTKSHTVRLMPKRIPRWAAGDDGLPGKAIRRAYWAPRLALRLAAGSPLAAAPSRWASRAGSLRCFSCVDRMRKSVILITAGS